MITLRTEHSQFTFGGLLLLAGVIALTNPTIAHSQARTREERSDQSFAELKRRIEALLLKDHERETKAQNVLSFAQKALADAQSKNDPASIGTAQQAVSIARIALEKARTITARDEE